MCLCFRGHSLSYLQLCQEILPTKGFWALFLMQASQDRSGMSGMEVFGATPSSQKLVSKPAVASANKTCNQWQLSYWMCPGWLSFQNNTGWGCKVCKQVHFLQDSLEHSLSSAAVAEMWGSPAQGETPWWTQCRLRRGITKYPLPTKEQHLGEAVKGRVHTLCAVHPPLFLANDWN